MNTDRWPMAVVMLVVLGCVTQDARSGWNWQDSKGWVEFPARESTTGRPARLLLKGVSAEPTEVAAIADAPLLSYLADRSFPALPDLPIGLGDQNRSIVKFALPERVTAADLRQAELILDLKPGKTGPGPGFTIAVHRVEKPWDEMNVTWANQPAFAKEPEALAKAPPRAGEIRIDLTSVVRRWLAREAENHGLLLKVHGATDAADVARRLARTLPWTDDVAAALSSAKTTHRPVLSLVRGAYQADDEEFFEGVLRATVFSDPSIVALVERRFVPLRVRYVPLVYTQQQKQADDPLAPLGGKSTDIKAPALLVSTAEGELVAHLQSIGTFDAELVHAFLRAALAKTQSAPSRAIDDPVELLAAGEIKAASAAIEKQSGAVREYGRARIAAMTGDHERARKLSVAIAAAGGDQAADARIQSGISAMRMGDNAFAREALAVATSAKPAPSRFAEALFWLGCIDRVLGDLDARSRAWDCLRKEFPESLWALRVEAHLTWPDRLDPVLCLRRVELPPGLMTSTERAASLAELPAVAARAAVWLLDQQRKDGAWPSEDEPARAAITAVCTKALFVWEESLPEPLRGRCKEAVSRGVGWLREFLAHEDPVTANSFGAAYVLDALLACTATLPKPDRKALVQSAIAFLLAGQCDNGAWSYSLEFHRGWRGGFGGWPSTDKGRAHSVNTGPSLVFLQLAKRQGFAVNEDALKRGVQVLREMRSSAGVYTYTYPIPRSFEQADQSIGRGPICELALFLAGSASRADVATALTAFRRHRASLRPNVKLDHSWSSPIASSSYFFFYAYYNATIALRTHGGTLATELAADLRADLLNCAELDGTWLDFENNGKPYGTAMALLVLR